MRILITRPEGRAEGTAAKLVELGHEPESFPLFQPVRDIEIARTALATPHSAIAVTSAEAMRVLADLGDGLTPYLGAKVFAVGRATARAAREAGFTDIEAGSGGGLELGNLVVSHFMRNGRPDLPVLYLAGEKRMNRFERVLGENGIPCFVAETYRMQEIPYTIEQQQAVLVAQKADGVFFYSRETADAFFALDIFRVSHDAIRKTLFFCLSRNIAEAVPEDLQNSAVASDSPDEDELIDLL
jgi:uroporphyrinogen-III synthase